MCLLKTDSLILIVLADCGFRQFSGFFSLSRFFSGLLILMRRHCFLMKILLVLGVLLIQLMRQSLLHDVPMHLACQGYSPSPQEQRCLPLCCRYSRTRGLSCLVWCCGSGLTLQDVLGLVLHQQIPMVELSHPRIF